MGISRPRKHSRRDATKSRDSVRKLFSQVIDKRVVVDDDEMVAIISATPSSED
jgi:orotate phosphoribosyltransferase-like protein